MKKLIEADEIKESVRKLGHKIEKYYEGEPLTILGVLTGSVILLSDLVRRRVAD
ncbi:MAG: hypothetical protein R3C11_22845 [Planctomycetaceae bacterium]